jgi:hypothetical protein
VATLSPQSFVSAQNKSLIISTPDGDKKIEKIV